MMFNFFKRIINVLLIPPLLLFASEVMGQCEVEIVDGSIVVIDYEPGVEFQFDIYNGSPVTYESGTLRMAWTLSSNDPIWEFELLTPIEPGETMTVTTPKLDMPAVWPGELNMFTAPDNQPTAANPWLESNDWFFYTQPFPYPGPLGNGNWVPIRLYLDDCTLFDADYIIDENGEYYYGPQISGCVNDVPDQFCDLNCDFEVLDFNQTSFTLQVNGSECYNLSQFPKEETLNSFITTFSYGNPIICTGNVNYNYFEPMVSGDIQTFDYYEYTTGGAYDCLEQIIAGIENDCRVTIGVGNPNILSPSLNINDFLTIQGDPLCDIVMTSPDIGIDSLTYQLGGCFGEPLYWIPEINVTNYGDETVTELCLEFDIWNVAGVTPDTICFDNLNILPSQSVVLELPQNFNGGDDQLLITTTLISSNGMPESFDPNNTLNSQFTMWCYDCIDPEADNYNPYATNNQDPNNCEYLGCTDPSAINYDDTANVDDGSCDYLGCTDPQASNYDPQATIDDGSCEYEGCTDPNALNYDPQATIDDGSCEYDVLGCTDPLADNYNSNATLDDGSCEYLGCTDPVALNYDPDANVNDGSCVYDIYGCTDPVALNYNSDATIDDDSCEYQDPCDTFDGSVFAPNAFTPNNDGLNDVWRVMTSVECWRDWDLTIYNRWGQIVYKMDDPSQFWNGSFRDGEYYVQDGVYGYTLKGVSWNSKTAQTSGVITILK